MTWDSSQKSKTLNASLFHRHIFRKFDDDCLFSTCSLISWRIILILMISHCSHQTNLRWWLLMTSTNDNLLNDRSHSASCTVITIFALSICAHSSSFLFVIIINRNERDKKCSKSFAIVILFSVILQLPFTCMNCCAILMKDCESSSWIVQRVHLQLALHLFFHIP